MTRTHFAALVMMTTAACSGDRLAGPTADTGFDQPCRRVYDGPVEIEEALITCETPTEVRFYARTRGWTSGITVFSQETGATGVQWADQHDLQTFKFGACQDFDMLERELRTGLPRAPGAKDEMWEVNQSTVFSCEQREDGTFVNHGDGSDSATMTYLLRAYAVDGSLASCLVFGHDPDGLLAGTYSRVLDPARPEELKQCIKGVTTGSKGTDKGTKK